MKKILTLMLALACALFVGVSCTKDSADSKKPKDAITFEYLGILSHEAAAYNLNYTVNVERTDFSQLVLGKPSADWLKVSLPLTDDDYVKVNVAANNADPGTPAREASFTATFDNHPSVTVVVKQGSYGVDFEFHFIDETKTCNYAQCYCVPKDNDLKYIAVSSSQLADLGVSGTTPAAQLKNYVEKLGKEGALGKPNAGYWFQGSSEDFPMDAFRVTPEDEVYVYAAGFEATPTGQVEVDPDTNEEYPIYTAVLVTPVNKAEVPFLPYPAFEVAKANLTQDVPCAEGSVEVDCVISNPITNGVVEFKSDAHWLTASWADNKLTLNYDANVSAIGRSTTLLVKYGVKKGADNSGYLETYADVTFTVRQEKDPEAEAPTYNITVTDNQFHKFVVDVTTSDTNVDYVVDYTLASSLKDGMTLSLLAQRKVEEAKKWGDKSESYRLVTHRENLQGYGVKLNVNSYENNDLAEKPKAHIIYVYPVDVESMTVLADPTFVEVEVDDSKRPTLRWIESNGITKQEGKDFYEVHVKSGETITLQYELTNPVEEGVVDVLNRAYIRDMNIIADNNIVFDQENCTLTFTVKDYDACSTHWYEFNLTYKDKNDPNSIWNTQSESLKIFLEQ